MTEPACVAQHAVRRSGAAAGQLLVIFGAGPIGIMAARWARLSGVRVLLADISEEKVRFAREKGFDAVDPNSVSVPEYVRSINAGSLADAAIEGTGASSALAGCIGCVRPCGSIALLGNPIGDTTLPLKVHSAILRKELSIKGVWNSSRAPIPIDEWAYTVRMMDAGLFLPDDLVTDRLTLDELPLAMTEIRERRRRPVKAMYVSGV